MKKALLIGCVMVAASSSYAQTKIKDGTVTSGSMPNAGAVLDLESNNKGLLMPRVSLTNTTVWGLAGTPAAGMAVYNTNAAITSDTATYPIIPGGIGEYYWDGDGWVSKYQKVPQHVPLILTEPGNLPNWRNQFEGPYADRLGTFGSFTIEQGGTVMANISINGGVPCSGCTDDSGSTTSNYELSGIVGLEVLDASDVVVYTFKPSSVIVKRSPAYVNTFSGLTITPNSVSGSTFTESFQLPAGTYTLRAKYRLLGGSFNFVQSNGSGSTMVFSPGKASGNILWIPE